MSDQGVVIIGAGQAGCAAAAKLRALGYDGKVTIIGEEPIPPYQRPPLSKAYLLGEMPVERLFLRPQSYYAEQSIDLILGKQVSALDATHQTISVDGKEIAFEHLILATGSTPRRLTEALGGLLPGTYTIRSVADIDAISPEFQQDRNLVILGGGYIGLEVAAVAAKLGLHVTLVEAAARILQRVAAEETADYFRALHHKNGVRILENTKVSRLLGEDHVLGVELESGEVLDADFVVFGIGVVPNVDLAETAGLTVKNGIQTDPFGRTSVTNIWAAGDCATVQYRGLEIRLESVGNAIDQAEAVAVNICGADTPYQPKPWFWSDQYDVKLQIAGLNLGYDRVVSRHMENGATSFWYFAGESLLAVDAMNDPRAYMISKRLIEAGKSPNQDVIADTAVDLKNLVGM